ncbi:MAG: M20/M25/M40 family metallo-hydrolase [Sphaerochaetaceae bacterium]|nr:M20/M25/M40 family metallo-hydrolase [Sphaerochaetaceae bacterium]MDC7236263.1 M20/M25/M40 family metallo-hydrolase [Sphaerochaetaceae bacterium]MDC7250293.1 M20/M25/M40 family metallo-hydrolase [Sphaerochaetaceae bacterium]
MEDRESLYSSKLAKMIQCETVSIFNVKQKEKFDNFHEVLRELFPHVFETCEVVDIEGSLLFKWSSKSPNGEPVLFMSHQDVVEASGDWKYPPFSGHIEDGVIWGRGTVDTKGSLFCIFQSIDELIEDGFEPPCDVYIASSCGEEVLGDGAKQTCQYLKDKGVHLRFVIDEGGMILESPMPGVKGRYAMIGSLEKSTGNYKFIARGQGGHASAPPKNTPIERLAKFIAYYEKHNPTKSKMNDVTAEMFSRLGKTTPGIMGFLMRHARGFSPLLSYVIPKVNTMGGAMFKTTVAFTTAKGANGLNVLPEEAYVTANVRFINHQGPKEMTRIFKEMAKKFDIEVEELNPAGECQVVDYNSKEFKLVEEVIRENWNDVIPSPYTLTGGTDARYYAPICENVFRFAPLEINQQQLNSVHAIDENICTYTLPPGVDFYKKVLNKIK